MTTVRATPPRRGGAARGEGPLRLLAWACALAPLLACGSDESATSDGSGDAGASIDGGASGDGGLGADGSAAHDGSTGDDGSTSTTPCWPYDRPAIATLRASSKKVFAHYFSPYPISLDNKPAATDYYTTGYLAPTGEGGIHASYGGLLRDRPLPQTPAAQGADYESINLGLEVRRAIAIGLDGFTFDMLSASSASIHWKRLVKLLAVIPTIDTGFKVQIVLDMTAAAFGGGGGTDQTALDAVLAVLDAFGSDPSLLRAPNGKIVVSAFGAEVRNAAFWTNALQQAAAGGHDVAFVPMTIGSWGSNAASFAGVPLFGASSWGVRTVGGAASLESAPTAPHAAGLVWMGGVSPQDSRPKNLLYTEANNSAAFRAQWEATIAGGADWVQLITWNDYSEDTEVAPSVETGNAFYDLSGYYTTWFKTGAQPPIVRDALYYVHRRHSMDTAVAPPDLNEQAKAFTLGPGAPMSNVVELVGLLTAPGTLEISIGGATQTKDVGAGIQSFTVPLAVGTPSFRLLRGGHPVVSLTSKTPISNTIVYQDPLYHAGTSLTCPVAM